MSNTNFLSYSTIALGLQLMEQSTLLSQLSDLVDMMLPIIMLCTSSGEVESRVSNGGGSVSLIL